MAEQVEVGIVDGAPTSGTGEVPTLAPIRDALGITSVDAATAGGTGSISAKLRTTTGQLAALGTTADDKSTATDTTPVTLISLMKQLSAYLATLNATSPALGPAAMAAAVPVAIANDQSAVPVSVPADPFGANADVASETTSISAKLRGIATALGITALDLGSGTGGSRTLRFFQDTAQWIGGSGAITSATQRVALATDSPGVAQIAHDGADSGNPTKIGGRARSSEIAPVANNDRSDLVTDLVGKLITLPYANPENFRSGAITSAMTGTTSTSLLAAPGASLRHYVTTIVVSNAHATVGTDIAIQDGSGGTTLMTIPAAAVYGGAVINLPVPLRQPTTDTAIFCANVTTGASTKVSAVSYIGA